MVEAIIANVIHAEFPDLDESLHNPGNWGARTAYQAGAMLFTGFLAHEMGLDPAVAGSAAYNAATNNFLTKQQLDEKAERLRNAKTPAERDQIYAYYADLDARQQWAATGCILQNQCGDPVLDVVRWYVPTIASTDALNLDYVRVAVGAMAGELDGSPRLDYARSFDDLNTLIGAAIIAGQKPLQGVYPETYLLGGGLWLRGGAAALKGSATVLGGFNTGRVAVGAGVGLGANGASQIYSMNQYGTSFDPWSFGLAGVTGGVGGNTSAFLPILSLNTGAALMGSGMNGQDPTNAVIGAVLGSIFGYGVGSIASAGAKGVTNSLSIRTQIWKPRYWNEGPLGMQSYTRTWEMLPGNVEVGFGTSVMEIVSGAAQNTHKK
jgi:hypothetical protein